MKKRYESIDIIKGIAVILMIFFHIFYMMNNMGFNKIDSSGPFLRAIAQISHITFIICAGVNLYLSYNNNKCKESGSSDKKELKTNNNFYKKKILRSLQLLFYGMVMTVLTKHVWGSKNSVKFGILHFMGVAILLSLLVFKLDNNKKSINTMLITLISIIVLFIILGNSNLGNSKLCKTFPFLCFILGSYGKHNYNFGSLDHHAIFHKYPYFAIGLMFGGLLLTKSVKSESVKSESVKSKSVKSKSDKSESNDSPIKKPTNLLVKILSYLGKNSLNVYLIHWFILYGIIYMFGGRPIVKN